MASSMRHGLCNSSHANDSDESLPIRIPSFPAPPVPHMSLPPLPPLPALPADFYDDTPCTPRRPSFSSSWRSGRHRRNLSSLLTSATSRLTTATTTPGKSTTAARRRSFKDWSPIERADAATIASSFRDAATVVGRDSPVAASVLPSPITNERSSLAFKCDIYATDAADFKAAEEECQQLIVEAGGKVLHDRVFVGGFLYDMVELSNVNPLCDGDETLDGGYICITACPSFPPPRFNPLRMHPVWHEGGKPVTEKDMPEEEDDLCVTRHDSVTQQHVVPWLQKLNFKQSMDKGSLRSFRMGKFSWSQLSLPNSSLER